MERLFFKFYKKLDAISRQKTPRNFVNEIDWTNRLIGLKGARGVGKTTLLLQYIKANLPVDGVRTLYVSLDDIYFSENRLVDFVDDFVINGGEYLFLDEVHRYTNWAQEIKNIYDDHNDLKIIFTGSSLLHLKKANADLSRRVVMYHMRGLSFREYLKLDHNIEVPTLNLTDLLHDHTLLARNITMDLKILPLFKSYLKYGYYPYFLENKDSYHQKLMETIHLILEVDIPQFESLSIGSINKMKQLLQILSYSVPFKPNIQKLSERMEITRNSLKQYLNYLRDTEVISALYRDTLGISVLQKPEKIYLGNTNMLYAFGEQNINIGNLRETFFLNQVGAYHDLTHSKSGDFLLNRQLTFEVGGKNKKDEQLKGISNAFYVMDDIEVGIKNKIPLWMFGLLY